jgi:hypothetical protein
METLTRRRSVMLFCLRFLVLVVVLVVLWWLFLPVYGLLLVQSSGAILKLLFSAPIDYGQIRPEGILNTKSLLVFGIGGRESSLPIALLVTNVPPYLALVLATLGLTWRRRLLILFYGVAILVIGHIVFLVYALEFQLSARAAGAASAHMAEIPIALGQFFLTLPFLLWIVFAYWERLAGYFGEEEEEETEHLGKDAQPH